MEFREDFRVVMGGSRDWTDADAIRSTLQMLRPSFVGVGDCPTGADPIIRDISKELGIPGRVYIADWGKFGRPAGPLRNRRMVESVKPSRVVGFLRSDRENRGTKNLLLLAERSNISTIEIWRDK